MCACGIKVCKVQDLQEASSPHYVPLIIGWSIYRLYISWGLCRYSCQLTCWCEYLEFTFRFVVGCTLQETRRVIFLNSCCCCDCVYRLLTILSDISIGLEKLAVISNRIGIMQQKPTKPNKTWPIYSETVNSHISHKKCPVFDFGYLDHT